jgi:hypothetical protein
MPVYKKHNAKPVIGYKGSELGYTDPVVVPIMFWFFKNSDGVIFLKQKSIKRLLRKKIFSKIMSNSTTCFNRDIICKYSCIF